MLSRKIKIHPLFIVLAAVMILTHNGYSFAIYVITLILHELVHSICAAKLGYKTSNLMLLPTGAVLYGQDEDFSAKDEIIIALCAPLVNLASAVLCVATFWLFPDFYSYTSVIFYSNLAVGLFNLVPAYPLDGGRVFLCLMSLKRPYKQCLKIIKTVGVVLSLAVFALYVVSCFFEINITLAMASIMLMQGALFDLNNQVYNKALLTKWHSRKLSGGLESKTVLVSLDSTLQKLLSSINHNYYYYFNIVDASYKVVAVIEQRQIEQLLIKHSLFTPLASVIGIKN